MAAVEKAGVPTVSFVARDFVTDFRQSARVFGVKQLPMAVVPRPFIALKAEDVHPYADAVFDGLIKGLTEPLAEEALGAEPVSPAKIITIEGEDRYAALEEMNRLFLERGWGDGFPLWAPTRERVDAMLAGTKRTPEQVVAVLDPGLGLATVEKIAINAVMAGCRPEHLPVLLAAVEAISQPKFMLHNVAMSTGPHAPMMLITGPIVKKLGINTGRCALGPGAQSAVNTALGRALRLIYMNIGHAYPGAMDMDTLGSPTKYSWCLGEHQEESPWEPFHVEKGFDRDTSVVTIFTGYGISDVDNNAGTTPEEVLDTACATACNLGVLSVGNWLSGRRADTRAGVTAKDTMMLIVCPVHAAIFRKHGWSKQNIREYLYKHARMPFNKLMAKRVPAGFRASHPDLQWLWDSPETMLPVVESPDCFEIAVAGGMGGGRSAYVWGAAEPQSRPIEE